MSFTVDRERFAPLLRRVRPAADGVGESTSGYVRIDTDGRVVTFSCSRSDLTISTTLELEGDAHTFQTFVPIAPLEHLATHGEARDLVFTPESAQHMKITSGMTESRLSVPDRLTWPNRPTAPGPWQQWPQDTLSAVARVAFAAAQPNDPPLSGIALRENWATATDRYRLATVRLPYDVGVSAIVPAYVMRMVADACENGCEVRIGEVIAEFKTADLHWRTRLVVGNYPQVAGMLETHGSHRVVLERAALIRALGRVRFFGESAVTVEIKDDGVTLRAAGAYGQIDDRLAGTANFEATAVLREQFLREALDAMAGDSVEIEFDDDDTKLVIRDGNLEQMLVAQAR